MVQMQSIRTLQAHYLHPLMHLQLLPLTPLKWRQTLRFMPLIQSICTLQVHSLPPHLRLPPLRWLQPRLQQVTKRKRIRILRITTRTLHLVSPTSPLTTIPRIYLLSRFFSCRLISGVVTGVMPKAGISLHVSSPTAASFYMQHGNPVQLAQCLRSSIQNHTHELIHTHRRLLSPARLLELSEQAKAKGEALTVDKLSSEGQFLLVYLTSDSHFSSEQMRSVLQYNLTVIAPSGCHIEHDTSLQCLELTVVQWFVLSLSSHIAVQTEQGGTPVSAFSRYAGVYRLQSSSHAGAGSDPVLLDGQHCTESPSHKSVSKLQQGNWFC